jgi:cell division protein FtsB
VAASITLGLAAVFGKGGLFDALRYRQERNRLRDEIARLESETTRLESELHALATDDLQVERIAREELSLARPGEVVVLLPTTPAQP